MYSLIVLSLLTLMVLLLIAGKPERHYVGLVLIVVLLGTGTATLGDILYYVEWDVLGLILCMSIFTVFLEESGLAQKTASFLVNKVKKPKLLSFLLILLSGIVSIALENVTVVLIFAPVVFRVVKRTSLDPVSLLVGVVLAANMAGSATLIGDPPAMIVAGHYNLGFLDFIFYGGRPSMFFLTLVPMMISTYIYSTFIVKVAPHTRTNINEENEDELQDPVFAYETLFFLSLKIVLLSIRHILGISLTTAASIGLGGLVITRILHGDWRRVRGYIVRGFEWKTLLFLAGVFTLSGSFEKHGLARALADAVLRTGSDVFVVTGILIWLSVAVSAVIDNVPYVATMLPVIDIIAEKVHTDPVVIVWSLLLGATLGGGITYIGASANVVGVRILEKKGYQITFYDFIKKSIPFNLANILSGWILYILLWLF